MPRMLHKPGPPAEGQKVFLATPVMGNPYAGYTFALFHSSAALSQAGIAAELAIFAGDCHVDDARNRLVRDFLESDCTDLVFLDADLRWQPDDLVRLCQYDRDVVAATYPFKQEEEGFPVRLTKGENWTDEDGLLRAEAVPTGFLRIRRRVLERLANQAKKFKPKSDLRGLIPLIFERTIEGEARWGGDYTFCRKWRALHGSIWLDPEIALEHAGDHHWEGSFGAFKRQEMGVTREYCLRAIAEGRDRPDTYAELVAVEGDRRHTAGPDTLAVLAHLARKATHIIEFGSGLSTAVMAAATKGVVDAYEHRNIYAEQTCQLVNGYQARLHLRPLAGEEPFYTDVHGQADLVFVDGPPRMRAPNRRGMWPVLDKVLKPGAAFVIDDMDNPDVLADLARWAEGKATYQIIHGTKSFAVGRLKERTEDGA